MDPVLDANGNPVIDTSGNDNKAVVTDQVLKITLPNGTVKEVKTADIFDEQGVPYRNRYGETQRRSKEIEDENNILRTQLFNQGENGAPAPKVPGHAQEEKQYTEEELNRMFMTGEATQAMNYIMKRSLPNPEEVVNKVLTRNTIRQSVAQKYPDLGVPQSEFFIRVARVMNENGLYNNPKGVAFAAAQVESDMRFEGKQVNVQSPMSEAEYQRSSQSGVHVVGGSPRTVQGGKPELDEAGKAMARNLGISEDKMAERLQAHLTRKPGGPRD